MNFQPKTEKQIAEENVKPSGVYPFEVVDATDEVSKAGNDMIKLQLRLFNAQGDGAGFVTDYLLESIAYKLRHAAVACGLSDAYEGGSLVASDFIGKSGDLKLAIKKDKTGKYPDQNMVADYLPPDGKTAPSPKSARDDVGDHIPF